MVCLVLHFCYNVVDVVIAFVYFYHAVLVHFFGEGEGRAEMGEGRCRGRECGGKEEGRKMGMHEKIAHKLN